MSCVEAPDFEVPKLGELLSFAIYSANLACGRAYRPLLELLGLTYTQWIVIVALGERDDQSVSSLGDTLFLESNTLTPVLKKLELAGLVRRQRSPADERQVHINLTEKGRRLGEKSMWERKPAHFGLAPGELVELQEKVTRIRDDLFRYVGKNVER